MTNSQNNVNQLESLLLSLNAKDWTPESTLLGILAKKLGKGGLISMDVKNEDFPNSLNINFKDGKLLIYAE